LQHHPEEPSFVPIRASITAFSRISLLAVAATALSISAQAQTAPQLLPYTAKLLAGGGSTAAVAGSTCQRGTTSSGNISYDTYGDGCLATEITLSTGSSGPRYAIVDSTGAVYFSDYANGLIRRIDPVTGIVTAVVGGAASNSTTSCGTRDPGHTPITGDLWADGCLGTSVKLGKPTGLVFNPATGDLYFSDTFSYNVRKMSLSNGGVAAVIINAGGSGYTSAPTVTFSAPPTGTTATGTANFNSTSGVVTGVTITNAGSGYTTAPTVTFSASNTGITATGTAVYTGVMSMAAGSQNGGSTGNGYTAGCSAAAAPSATLGTTCLLRAPYGLTFDSAGNLYIVEEYYYALLVLNTNTSGSTTVLGQTVPAQTLVKVAGSKASGAACVNGTANSSGCSNGTYTNGTAAASSELYNPYGVALDSSNDVFIADEDYSSVAEVSSTATLNPINSFAGAYPLTGIGAVQAATKRAAAGSFTIGSDYSVSIDTANNVYIPDALAGYVWRVDATTNTMYVVGGGGAATTAGTACASSGAGSTQTAVDAYGDGCPATLAKFSNSCSATGGSACPTNGYGSTGVFGVFADHYSDVFVGDEGNGLVREIASGTQFGSTGASATDYIDIHFAAGDTPITASGATVPFAITSGSSVFTLGTPACTVNTDNNGNTNTEDCVVPVTAAPTATGPYSGTLTVKSTLVPGGTSFPLTGNFVQSPVTRLAVTSASSIAACSGTTYATVTPVVLTASLTANGPAAPTGTMTFYTGPTGSLTQIGQPQTVTNIGTNAAPVYGANLTYTFSTAGSYNVTAVYTPTNGSYFLGSSNSTSLTSQTAAFSLAAIPYQQSTVTAGQTALYSFLINQANFTGTINFTVTGLPANTTYSISPSSVTGVGCVVANTAALSIFTQQKTTVTPGGFGGTGHSRWQLLSMALGLGLALLIGLRRRRVPMRYGQLMMALALLVGLSGTLACGKAVGTVLQPATPSGSYTITVTASSYSGSTLIGSSQVTFPLVVN